MLCSISIESHATEVLNNGWTTNISVNKSVSKLSYRSCNYGEIEFSTIETDHSETGQLGVTEDYFFYYYDYMQRLFTASVLSVLYIAKLTCLYGTKFRIE